MGDSRAIIRLFTSADADAVVALYAANSQDAVDDPAADGFVQGGMTAERIRAMAGDGGVFVAEDEREVVGFVCSGPPPTTDRPSAIRSMVETVSSLQIDGRDIDSAPWVTYGPTVVDRGHRGRGLARELLEAVRERWAPEARTAVLFIEESNRASLAVHLDGFGMTRVGGFTFDGRDYAVAAFSLT